jgi:RNA polymerase sigma-70 factor (ECF subfamily)
MIPGVTDLDGLVVRAQRGDAEGREGLARAWLPRLYGVALSITGRAAEAEDVIQEAFLRAFRSLAGLRDPSRFGPWILRIVRNAARDLARRPPRPSPLEDDGRSLPGRDPGPSEAAADAVVAWRGLPEDQRLVCWLKVVEGMALREIADLLGASKSAVDRTYRKGLERMRKETARCRPATA